ncbi:MAG: hypothetical protein Q9219_001979 [cf. Caloplaca sp. 3 TL-2023]
MDDGFIGHDHGTLHQPRPTVASSIAIVHGAHPHGGAIEAKASEEPNGKWHRVPVPIGIEGKSVIPGKFEAKMSLIASTRCPGTT